MTFPYTFDFNQTSGNWSGVGYKSSWEHGTPSKLYINDDRTKAWVSGGLGITTYNSDEKSYLLSPLFDFTNEVNELHNLLIE